MAVRGRGLVAGDPVMREFWYLSCFKWKGDYLNTGTSNLGH